MKVFAVFDTKVNAYLNPFLMRTRGEAIRGFAEAANDEKTTFAKHPDDFILFEIGTWDEYQGKYTNEASPVSIGSARQFVETREPIHAVR
jgi:uncharacterized protein YozE (UPF0346 family)